MKTRNICFCYIGLVALTAYNLTLLISRERNFNRASQAVDLKNFTEVRASIANLPSLTSKQREKVAGLAFADIKDLNEDLFKGLASNDNEVRCYAMFLMGTYRLKENTGLLNGQLTLTDGVKRPFGTLWWWGKYPAVEALVNIGQPSVSFMTQNLKDSTNTLERKLSLYVIYQVYRDEAMVKFVIEREFKAEKDPASRARLRDALKLCDEKVWEKI